jgi:hypothetical protein
METTGARSFNSKERKMYLLESRDLFRVGSNALKTRGYCLEKYYTTGCSARNYNKMAYDFFYMSVCIMY